MANTYSLKGTLLEACSCGAPCPCWVGDAPDGDWCDSFNAYHIDQGHIQGVDVSGLTVVSIAQIPGNVLDGNWRSVNYIDAQATLEQRELLIAAWTGQLGGPLGDLAQLIGERIAVYSAPIEHQVKGGKGTLRVGTILEAEMAPFTDSKGRPTTIHDSAFSTIPGTPAYLAKASYHRVSLPEHGMTWEFTGRNAIQGEFLLESQ